MFTGENVLSTIGGVCRTCGGETVFKSDAIGRVNERCPKCDGVSAPTVMHPSLAAPVRTVEVLRTTAGTTAGTAKLLPILGPGEHHCQRCARPVPIGTRFCVPCRAPRAPRANPVSQWRTPTYQPKPCRGCRQVFSPTLKHREYCPTCAATPEYQARRDGMRKKRGRNGTTRPCLGCARPVLRTRGRPRKDCDACRV